MTDKKSQRNAEELDEQVDGSILSLLDAIDRRVSAVQDRLASLAEQHSQILAAIARLESSAPIPEPQEFLTVKQAAAYLNVSENSIYRMKHLHVKRGRSIRVRRSTIDHGFREDPRAANYAKRKKAT